MLRICFDLDGTLCTTRTPDQSYKDVKPIPEAVEALKELYAAGHTIIIYTARHMKTCGGDQGRVVARIAPVTIAWLEKHAIPYHEIYFGKPYADVYVDDNVILFKNDGGLLGDIRGRIC